MSRKSKISGSDFMKLPYVEGDQIPAPEATEVESEGAFEAWAHLNAKEQARFAKTQPMSALPTGEADPSYATTEPARLTPSAAPAPAAPVPRPLSLDEVLLEARRFNRVCPQPAQWQQLYDAMTQSVTSGKGRLSPVLTGAAWQGTAALSKRMAFREHLEWADRHGNLAPVAQFLKDMPEESWYHMGD